MTFTKPLKSAKFLVRHDAIPIPRFFPTHNQVCFNCTADCATLPHLALTIAQADTLLLLWVILPPSPCRRECKNRPLNGQLKHNSMEDRRSIIFQPYCVTVPMLYDGRLRMCVTRVSSESTLEIDSVDYNQHVTSIFANINNDFPVYAPNASLVAFRYLIYIGASIWCGILRQSILSRDNEHKDNCKANSRGRMYPA